MKTLIAALVVSFALTGQTQDLVRVKPQRTQLTLALKSNHEVRELMLAHPELKKTDAATDLAASLHAGQRAYQWIHALNQHRPAGAKPLSFSDPSTTTSPSMEQPKIYNLAIAKKLYADVSATWPKWYRDVIEGTDPVPLTLPVSELEFIDLGLKTTLAYDTACRWILMQDYLGFYETQKILDMRGYYFISILPDRDAKLDGFNSLSAADKAQIHEWIVGVCLNNEDSASYSYDQCDRDVGDVEKQNGLKAYFAVNSVRSKEIWAQFFELDDLWIRTDINWSIREPDVFHYPFLQPTNPVIAAYLRDNVEDEWKIGTWHLKMDFTTVMTPTLSHLEYQANTTPHAEKDKIVMDENEPLTEYLAQWTIRHEFGHLLGFKDCYVEYYDTKLQAMVNYPIDPTNLMCSRRGHLQQQHFDVLKAAYYGKAHKSAHE